MFGGFGEIVTVLIERIRDQFALEIAHQFVNGLAGANDQWRVGFGAQARLDMEVRDVPGLDIVGCLEDHGTFHGVAQFAHVARPMMREQFLPRARRDAADVLAHRGVENSQEVFGQQQNIGATFAQGRRAKLNDIEAMKKIFAELLLLDRI